MEERLSHPKWQVKKNAYKAIANNFISYSARQKNKPQMANDDEEEKEENPFELYGSWLEKMITDQNLIAQFEGLECLAAYI